MVLYAPLALVYGSVYSGKVPTCHMQGLFYTGYF